MFSFSAAPSFLTDLQILCTLAFLVLLENHFLARFLSEGICALDLGYPVNLLSVLLLFSSLRSCHAVEHGGI